MNSRSNDSDRHKPALLVCEECGLLFVEMKGVVAWKAAHPSKRILCIECDPEAEKPALVSVTLAGWAEKD